MLMTIKRAFIVTSTQNHRIIHLFIIIKKFIKTDTLQFFAKHRIAGQLYNIPLMYDLVLWNRFLIKKIQEIKNLH